MDGRLGDPFPPVGETYFKKLSDLRNAIEESGLQQAVIVPDWSRKTPDGWKIRSLTSDEVKFLQAKAPDR